MSSTHAMPADYRFKDRSGKRFGRLVVMDYAGRWKSRKFLWKCLCDCGATIVATGNCLVTGRTTSCGCLRREVPNHFSHGHNRVGMRTPEYRSWVAMIQRCTNSNADNFERYGAKGVKGCQRWLGSFVDFLADMGTKPTPRHTIDRINNDKGYEPGNCRWATRLQQAKNKKKKRHRSLELPSAGSPYPASRSK